MPTYDYTCPKCGKFEAFHSMSQSLTDCPTCHSPIQKMMGGGGYIIFRGQGFYETDYKKSEPPKVD